MKNIEKANEKLKILTENIRRNKDFSFIFDLQKNYKNAEIFLVGGIIRDEILGRKSKDFDFVVRNIEPTKLRNFLSDRGWVGLVGKNFGVYKFVPKKSKLGEEIDIALPRTEISTGGGGYRDFDVQSDPKLSIEDDLSRRDFTMNAIALDMNSGRVVDPYRGIEDIGKKVIRTVGEPEERFSEDYSRILRAIRFAAELEFEIERQTWQAIKRLAPAITTERKAGNKKHMLVPYETIAREFLKTIDADPYQMFKLYEESGIMKILFPEIEAAKGVEQPYEFHEEGDVFKHIKICMANTPKDCSRELKLAVFLHDIGKPPTQKIPEKDKVDRIRFDGHTEAGVDIAKNICKRMKLANEITDHVLWLIKNHMLFVTGKVEDMKPNTIKKYFIDYPKRGDDLLELYRIDVLSSKNKYIDENIERYKEVKNYIADMRQAFKEAQIKTFRHVVSGNDVMEYFNIEPGPIVGKVLAKADEYIINYVQKNKKEPERKNVLNYLKKQKILKLI